MSWVIADDNWKKQNVHVLHVLHVLHALASTARCCPWLPSTSPHPPVACGPLALEPLPGPLAADLLSTFATARPRRIRSLEVSGEIKGWSPWKASFTLLNRETYHGLGILLGTLTWWFLDTVFFSLSLSLSPSFSIVVRPKSAIATM